MILVRHRMKPSRKLGGSAGAGAGKVSEWARSVLGFEADEGQAEVLDCEAKHLLLCCSRQWGKSTVAAVKALHVAVTRPGTRTLVVAPGVGRGICFWRPWSRFWRRRR